MSEKLKMSEFIRNKNYIIKYVLFIIITATIINIINTINIST
jgi:hypothetical protein